jgi:hypothetical protein
MMRNGTRGSEFRMLEDFYYVKSMNVSSDDCFLEKTQKTFFPLRQFRKITCESDSSMERSSVV